MTRTRNLLHYNKLNEFVKWAESQGYELEPSPPEAHYEVARLRQPNLSGTNLPILFYKRARTDHVTTHGEGTELVEKWLNEKNGVTKHGKRAW